MVWLDVAMVGTFALVALISFANPSLEQTGSLPIEVDSTCLESVQRICQNYASCDVAIDPSGKVSCLSDNKDAILQEYQVCMDRWVRYFCK